MSGSRPAQPGGGHGDSPQAASRSKNSSDSPLCRSHRTFGPCFYVHTEGTKHLPVQKCPLCRGRLDRAVPLLCLIQSICIPEAGVPAGEALAFERSGRGLSPWDWVGGWRAECGGRGGGGEPPPPSGLLQRWEDSHTTVHT